MRKIFTIFIFIFVVGCSSIKNKTTTIIEQKENMLISINYPITNTKIDSKIKKDINKIETDFKNKYQSSTNQKSELNIDYNYSEINGYISVIIHVYIRSPRINEEINYVISYLYDTNKDKYLEINDIVDMDDIKQIIDINNSDINIGFDYKNINIYLNNKNNINEFNIPINEIKTKINLISKKVDNAFKIDIPSRIIDPNDKIIALTFDDGPSIYTEEIIEYLHDNDCVATFFILGNKVEMYTDTIKKSISYGNEIGNHSYNHKWLAKLKEEEMLEQINKTQNIITEKIGYTPTLLRPSYGSTNKTMKEKVDLEIILWNVDTMDWKYKSVNKIVSRATKNLKDGNIILMHDTYKRTLEAVKKIVPILKKNNYTCVTISEMNEINFIRKLKNEKWRS